MLLWESSGPVYRLPCRDRPRAPHRCFYQVRPLGYHDSYARTCRRTPQLHLGLQVGGSFSQNVVWDGTATALTAGALAARRIGALGDTPVALEGGLGVTRVHEDLCDGGNCTGVVSRTTAYVYASSALRVTTMNGRLAYRLGVVTLMSDSDPFVLPGGWRRVILKRVAEAHLQVPSPVVWSAFAAHEVGT